LPSASAPSSSGHRWSVNPVTWVVRLGEIPVLRSRFRVLQLDGHFLDRAGEEVPSLPGEARRAGVAGALIRSQVLGGSSALVEMKGGMIRYLVNPAPRYWIDLSGTFTDYTAKFSSKTRQTFGRKTRKLLGMGASFQTYRTPEEMERFIGLARALSAKTYQERLLGVGFPSDPAFHASILERSREGRERGFLLVLEERPIAYLYTPESHPGVLSYHTLGYDPEFEQLSPGTVLQYLALESLFQEGKHRIYDFGEGETEQKKLFGTHHVRCADLYLLRPTISNLGRVGTRVAIESVSSGIVWTLDRIGVKRWVKRLLRRKLVAAGPRHG
jgi:hypothetical protein